MHYDPPPRNAIGIYTTPWIWYVSLYGFNLPPMDRRLQRRYVQMVKEHMSSSTRSAAGPSLLPGESKSASATQAVWRFLNNDRVRLTGLVEPLRQAGREAASASRSQFVLLIHDWCKLDYGRHASKSDLRQLTHEHDVGYELTTALLVDAHDGAPLAPMQLHVKTAHAVYSTAEQPPHVDDHHLDQLQSTMNEVARWEVPRQVVHVIDREGDSLGHFRRWDEEGHKFLVRCDDRRVLWEDEPRLISEIADCFDRELRFESVGKATYRGQVVEQEVAETEIVLHRPHKTRVDGKQYDVPGRALPLRLVITRLIDEKGYILAQWTLLTNVTSEEVRAYRIALWYYWRWRIENFFKLLKSHGQELEHWLQENGKAITRRLLVAAMACVVVWQLQHDDSPEAEEAKSILMRLSGRSTKRHRPCTAPGLLAGYMTLLSITDLLEHTDCDLRTLKRLAKNALPFVDSS